MHVVAAVLELSTKTSVRESRDVGFWAKPGSHAWSKNIFGVRVK